MEKKEMPFLFGCAYYEEYLPYDRLAEDMRLMKEAGFNCIRIAESTWSTLEPERGKFDFSHLDRVIFAAKENGISVIAGTPTYAMPAWLALEEPGVLVTTREGKARFGTRQNMDLTNPAFLSAAVRVTEALVKHVAPYENVIGFQIDNETKHYGNTGERLQGLFRAYLKEKFGTPEALNKALGLAYWSNTVTDFSLLPDVNGAVHAGILAAFEEFRRKQAAKYLLLLSETVRRHKRPDQFITHNFDFDWHSFGAPGTQDGFSDGLQPGIQHFEAAKALDIAGCDVYHPTQDFFTGTEIAFAGSELRALTKTEDYLVLETAAQGFRDFLPYPGQLRLHAWCHVAAGAKGILYWQLHSPANGPETYWKGLLSHDYSRNPTFLEAAAFRAEFACLAPELRGLKIERRVGVLLDNRSQTALSYFPTDKDFSYNDMLLRVYRALYRYNIPCDLVFPESPGWEQNYDCLILPFLYTTDPERLRRLREFTARGGTLVAFPRCGFADENLSVYADSQPHGLTDVFGVHYSRYTKPVNVRVGRFSAEYWMELLEPDGAEVIFSYRHRYWKDYAAVTRHTFGQGNAYYIGFVPGERDCGELLFSLLSEHLPRLSLFRFPLVVSRGVNADRNRLCFFLNAAGKALSFAVPEAGTELLTQRVYAAGEEMCLPEWGVGVMKLSAGEEANGKKTAEKCNFRY